jgi:hypothetical protein
MPKRVRNWAVTLACADFLEPEEKSILSARPCGFSEDD